LPFEIIPNFSKSYPATEDEKKSLVAFPLEGTRNFTVCCGMMYLLFSWGFCNLQSVKLAAAVAETWKKHT
jgi:hypothetical protein